MSSATALVNVVELPKKRGEYGKGSCYQRADNGRWEISFYDTEGRRRRQSFSTQAKAEKALNTFLRLKESGKLDAPEGRAKTDTLAEHYLRYMQNSKPKSHLWVKRTWKKHLEPFFGGRIASRVSTADFEAYIEERKSDIESKDEAANRSRNSTINRELAILSAMYNYGMSDVEPALISRVPRFPKRLRESDPRSGYLNDAQYDALHAACPHKWLHGFLAIAYNFGFRKGELLGLKVGQVDFDGNRIALLPGTTKNDKGRVVYMTADVQKHIAPCAEGKSSEDHLFTWENGDQVCDFRVAWAKMCAAAKVAINPHDFRRTAIRTMVRQGVPESVAMRASGHKTRSVFERYNIVSDSDLVEVARKLDARRNVQG